MALPFVLHPSTDVCPRCGKPQIVMCEIDEDPAETYYFNVCSECDFCTAGVMLDLPAWIKASTTPWLPVPGMTVREYLKSCENQEFSLTVEEPGFFRLTWDNPTVGKIVLYVKGQ